ncbi:MAG: hypothetical protein AAF735_08565 [Myxococcota bacterium]
MTPRGGCVLSEEVSTRAIGLIVTVALAVLLVLCVGYVVVARSLVSMLGPTSEPTPTESVAAPTDGSDQPEWLAILEPIQDKLHAGIELTDAELLFYDVETLYMEVHSGASFEQYFRFATLEQIQRIESQLHQLDLGETARLTRRAIGVAFPDGIPKTPGEKHELTYWAKAQEQQLDDLAKIFTKMDVEGPLLQYYKQARE